jgi:hypothetical protein
MQVQNGKDAAASGTPTRLRNLLAPTRHRHKASEPRAPQPVTQSLIDATLNAMPTHVAILDGDGRIVLVNRAWRYFAASLDRQLPGDLVGVEYLKSGILGALRPRDGLMLRMSLKAMLRGDVEHVQRVIHIIETDRWYQLTAGPFEYGGANRIVLTHEDISAVHAAQETIKDLSQRLLSSASASRSSCTTRLRSSSPPSAST